MVLFKSVSYELFSNNYIRTKLEVVPQVNLPTNTPTFIDSKKVQNTLSCTIIELMAKNIYLKSMIHHEFFLIFDTTS